MAGQLYAIGILIVSAAALPSMVGVNTPSHLSGNLSPVGRPFRRRLTGQTDLPVSAASGSLTDSPSGGPIYCWIKP